MFPLLLPFDVGPAKWSSYCIPAHRGASWDNTVPEPQGPFLPLFDIWWNQQATINSLSHPSRRIPYWQQGALSLFSRLSSLVSLLVQQFSLNHKTLRVSSATGVRWERGREGQRDRDRERERRWEVGIIKARVMEHFCQAQMSIPKRSERHSVFLHTGYLFCQYFLNMTLPVSANAIETMDTQWDMNY